MKPQQRPVNLCLASWGNIEWNVSAFSIPKLTRCIYLIWIVDPPCWVIVLFGARGKSALCHFQLWSLNGLDQNCLCAIWFYPAASAICYDCWTKFISWSSNTMSMVQSVPSNKAWGITVGCLQSTSIGMVEEVPSGGCNATKCLQNSERAECSPKLLCQGWCMRHQISSTSCPHLFSPSPHTHTLSPTHTKLMYPCIPGMRHPSPLTSLCTHCTFPSHRKLCPQTRVYITTTFVGAYWFLECYVITFSPFWT